ncbi:MAG TPA: glycosyltransferase [Chthoniobacteraceae bacterium]|jgi:glycosyltransferase involved in cell wall biosynthesis|nr:glycosyltransferase [Chthoniobacteraceae bacterium]
MDEPARRPLRVLHVVFSLDAGGMENGIVNVSAALSRREFEPRVCCLGRGGAFVSRFPVPSDVTVLGKKEGFSPRTIGLLARHIRETRPDVIHTHNLGPLLYTVLARPHAPIVHGEHAELTPGELAIHRRLMRRVLYTRVRGVHTVSHSLRESLVRQGFPASKIEVIVNGVDTTRFRPGPKADARRETGLPPDAAIIGLMGRFGAYKRHADLIAAFERLAPGNPSLALLFVGGGGPLEEATRARVAASPFSSRIHLAGLQANPRPWYQAMDLLIIPSVNEGLSNALLEAMACGIPALGHFACGNGDVIKDSANGFLRDISTVDRLVDKIGTILAAPENLRRLGREARRTAEGQFAFAGMVEGYRRLYASAAGRLT